MRGLQDQYRNTNLDTFGKELDTLFENHVYKPIDDFYELCYNMDTASSDGLDLWGIVLKFPRYIKNYIEGKPIKRLDDDQYRKILKIKALQLRGGVSIPDLNRYMEYLFSTESGKAYVQDSGDMSFVAYVFEYVIDSWLWYVFNNYDILPHPGGVGTKIFEVILYPFAFKGQAKSNFYNVNFYNGSKVNYVREI